MNDNKQENSYDESTDINTEAPEEDDEALFLQDLNDAVERYHEHPGDWSLSWILAMLLYGASTKIHVSMPADLDVDDDGEPNITPKVLTDKSDNSFLVIQTRPDEKMNVTATFPISGIIRVLNKDDELSGLVINPFSENIQIPSVFFSGAAMFYNRGWEDALETEKEKRNSKEQPEADGLSAAIECSLPMTQAQFFGIERLLYSLRRRPHDRLTLNFRDPDSEDGLLFMRAERNKEGYYHVEIAFDMSEFDWDHPLILGHDGMHVSDAIELFHEIGVNCTSVDDIDIVQNEFRDISSKEE